MVFLYNLCYLTVVLTAPAALHLSYTPGLGPVLPWQMLLALVCRHNVPAIPGSFVLHFPELPTLLSAQGLLGLGGPAGSSTPVQHCSGARLGSGCSLRALGARGMATRAPLRWKLPVPECRPGLVQRWILSDRDRTLFHSRKMYNLLSVNKPDVCCCRAEHLSTSSDCKFWAADIWV